MIWAKFKPQNKLLAMRKLEDCIIISKTELLKFVLQKRFGQLIFLISCKSFTMLLCYLPVSKNVAGYFFVGSLQHGTSSSIIFFRIFNQKPPVCNVSK